MPLTLEYFLWGFMSMQEMKENTVISLGMSDRDGIL